MDQILDGELVAMPRPSWGHARASSVLGVELRDPSGWLVVDKPELHLGRDVVVPDLAGWKRDRLPPLAAQTPWVDVPPDWVCEVLSPSTSSIDRVKKKHIYSREKVSWYWLIDPEARTLEVLKLGESGHWVEVGTWAAQATFRVEPFDALEIDLAALWVDG